MDFKKRTDTPSNTVVSGVVFHESLLILDVKWMTKTSNG